MAPALERFAEQKEVEHPAADVFIVLTSDLARLHRQRFMHLAEHLFADLVHADHWTTGIIGPSVDLEHILHMPDKVTTLLGRDHPLTLPMRLERVFF
jgi:hypothetical protein